MLKLLIGGSPCTHWSIAQSKNRETKPEGLGWELFKNYLIAKEKFQPDFFLYENNKSAAQSIKDQISRELGVDLMHINSALVSAQNRQRFYAFNWTVEQPEDRGILLRDVLESGAMEHGYSLSEPVACRCRGRKDKKGNGFCKLECRSDEKANALDTNVTNGAMVAEPSRIGTHPNGIGELKDSKGNRIYDIHAKAVTLCANGGGWGAKTGLYAIPIEFSNGIPAKAISCADGKTYPVYEVRGGKITIKGNTYGIKLEDGYYIIRKLTVTECCRLQTMPDDYCRAVSNSQAYKGLGNGWTAEVIVHILNGALANVPKDEELVVLSMYDGIGTGRYCLDKMGFTNVKYYAYEIDKFARQIAMSNYPDIIQMGDAFDVRKEDWRLSHDEQRTRK